MTDLVVNFDTSSNLPWEQNRWGKISGLVTSPNMHDMDRLDI